MLFFDLETKADLKYKKIYTANIKAPSNYKDSIKIQQYVEAKLAEAEMEMALDQDVCQIASIAVLETGATLCGELDVARLVTFEELAKLLDYHLLVTFNGKSFDLPIILKTAIKLGLSQQEFPYQKVREGIKKYSTYPHTDLMEVLALNNSYKAQDWYMQVYLGRSKKPIDFATCTKEELEQHNLEDAVDLKDLYMKFQSML